MLRGVCLGLLFGSSLLYLVISALFTNLTPNGSIYSYRCIGDWGARCPVMRQKSGKYAPIEIQQHLRAVTSLQDDCSDMHQDANGDVPKSRLTFVQRVLRDGGQFSAGHRRALEHFVLWRMA